jgi:hypothetical protein
LLVLLPRLTRLAAAGLVAGVPVALAGGKAAITPKSIAGARTGLTHSAYKRILGKPVLVESLENNYSRLVFTRRKVEVYFHARVDTGVVVGTWNRRYRTANAIGPCSTVAALKSAYGRRLTRVVVGGSLAGYRLGKLVFRVDAGRVRAVSLKALSAPLFLAIATSTRNGGCRS